MEVNQRRSATSLQTNDRHPVAPALMRFSRLILHCRDRDEGRSSRYHSAASGEPGEDEELFQFLFVLIFFFFKQLILRITCISLFPHDAQNVKKVMNYSVDHPTHLPIVCDDKVLYLGS